MNVCVADWLLVDVLFCAGLDIFVLPVCSSVHIYYLYWLEIYKHFQNFNSVIKKIVPYRLKKKGKKGDFFFCLSFAFEYLWRSATSLVHLFET